MTDNLGQFLYFLENVKSLEHRSVALQWHRVKAASYISYATTQKGWRGFYGIKAIYINEIEFSIFIT